MDPNATLEALIEAALNGDADELREMAEHLADWLDKRGFPPGLQELKDFVDELEDDE